MCQICHAPSAGSKLAAGNALMSPFVSSSSSASASVTMMKLCQPVVNNQRSQKLSPTACQLKPARSYPILNFNLNLSAAPRKTQLTKKRQNSVTNALMTAGCDGQKRSSPYHRIIFDTSDSCQRFANSLCRFRPQMRHENVENNLLNATNSICQCGSDASIKTGQCRQSFKHK